MRIERIEGSILYQNPRPHVRSRHGYFPGLVRLASGDLLALFVMAEAFEAANGTTMVARSTDHGRSWNVEGRLYDKRVVGFETTDTLKPTLLGDGSLVAMGYRFHRHDPEMPIAVEETGGILPGDDIISFSHDEGRSWTVPQIIPHSRPELLEISGPCLPLRSGDLVVTAAPYQMPDGSNPSGPCGILLRSRDLGRTWTDDEVFFRSRFAPLESRLCSMGEDRLVAIAWAYSYAESKSYPNHIVTSNDAGRTWSDPIDTGIHAQSSNLTWLHDDLLLSIHAHREVDPGLVVRIVKLTGTEWCVMKEATIWGEGMMAQGAGARSSTETFRNLKFGQPSLLRLNPEEFLAAHWSIEDGQGKIRLHRLRVTA